MLVRSPMNIRTISILALVVAHAATYVQSAILCQWQTRIAQTQSKLLGWSVPLITQYPSLIRVMHNDVVMQINAAHTTTCRLMEAVA